MAEPNFGGRQMWISLFAIAIGVSIGLSVAAMLMQPQGRRRSLNA